ncbi:integrase arm-type DNA-binding domain-containing protein [Taklimakanibacter deserti]|uniref:integrase arm-type DNA-binding domain-containing protein n=1 Tax=Taklimakanibacter deserti TaxID=2267839 RepID=UPI000E657BCE
MLETITLKTIAKAQKAGEPVYIWDTQLSGFGAYVTARGTSWLIQKWQGGRGGKAQRVVIGSTKNGMALDDARKAASIALGEVSNGKNLATHKREQRSKLRDDLNNTLLSAKTAYLDQAKPSTGTVYYQDIETTLDWAISELGNSTPISGVTKADIRKLLKGKARQRNRFAILRPFFKWCVSEDLITVSPMASLPSPRPPASRDRLLADDEIKA